MVTPDAATNSPSSQATLSPCARLSLRNRLQPLNSVQVQESVAFGLPVHDLWNGTNDCRTENHGFRFRQPDSWSLMRHNRQGPLVSEVAVTNRHKTTPDQPLPPRKHAR